MRCTYCMLAHRSSLRSCAEEAGAVGQPGAPRTRLARSGRDVRTRTRTSESRPARSFLFQHQPSVGRRHATHNRRRLWTRQPEPVRRDPARLLGAVRECADQRALTRGAVDRLLGRRCRRLTGCLRERCGTELERPTGVGRWCIGVRRQEPSAGFRDRDRAETHPRDVPRLGGQERSERDRFPPQLRPLRRGHFFVPVTCDRSNYWTLFPVHISLLRVRRGVCRDLPLGRGGAERRPLPCGLSCLAMRFSRSRSGTDSGTGAVLEPDRTAAAGRSVCNPGR